MKINRLVIENFKSIEQIELIEPNPFTVFVGPNGSGKSNIFEGLEFVNLKQKLSPELATSLFGGRDEFLRRQSSSQKFRYEIDMTEFAYHDVVVYEDGKVYALKPIVFRNQEYKKTSSYDQFFDNFTRLFVRNDVLVKLLLNDDRRLSLSAKNLEKVLKRVLMHQLLKNEIFDWLGLFVPEFQNVEVIVNPFNGEETLLWYEQYSEKPFTKNLISDGTYNILALLTAVYQSEEPQFLCIEEPEIGLHPQVIMSLVDFFRQQCEEKGHYIWLNTHSESLVRKLRPEEIILVDKREGATHTKQVGGRDFYDLQMDEAWLTGALGGGLPW